MNYFLLWVIVISNELLLKSNYPTSGYRGAPTNIYIDYSKTSEYIVSLTSVYNMYCTINAATFTLYI